MVGINQYLVPLVITTSNGTVTSSFILPKLHSKGKYILKHILIADTSAVPVYTAISKVYSASITSYPTAILRWDKIAIAGTSSDSLLNINMDLDWQEMQTYYVQVQSNNTTTYNLLLVFDVVDQAQLSRVVQKLLNEIVY